MEVYKTFSKELVDSLNPETAMEQQFAQTVADTQWRLNRARSFEDGMLALGHYEEAGNFEASSPEIHSALTAAKVFRERSKDFVNLSLYEQRLSRAQKEAFRQLRELQAQRKASLKQTTPETKPLAQTAVCGAIPIGATSPEGNGFVCSSSKNDHGPYETVAFFSGPFSPRPAATPVQTPEMKAA